MPPADPPRRYESPTYARADLAARREAARRRRRRQRLITASITLLLLIAGGVAAWGFIGGGFGGDTAAGGDTTANGGGGAAVNPSHTGTAKPGHTALPSQTASPRPSSSDSQSPGAGSSSPGSPSPGQSPPATGTFTGKYVPILMYHRIEETADTSSNSRYFTSLHKFKQQMRALQYNGYTAVTLQQVWDYWQDKGSLPAKPIVLTFDDGTSGIAENAGPVLKKMRWPGVLFPVVPNINDSGGSLSLTPAQVKRLIADGWELGSHSISHPAMSRLDASRLQYELAESRRRLQEQFGVPVNFFCYPGGDHNATVEAAVAAAGYLGATTVVRGCADPATPYALDRIEVDGRNVIKTFMRDLEYWQQHP